MNNVDKRVAHLTTGVEATLGDARILVNNVDGQVQRLATSFVETANTATRAITRAEKTFQNISDITGEDTATINQLHRTMEALRGGARH